jgi:hypothetical protein
MIITGSTILTMLLIYFVLSTLQSEKSTSAWSKAIGWVIGAILMVIVSPVLLIGKTVEMITPKPRPVEKFIPSTKPADSTLSYKFGKLFRWM